MQKFQILLRWFMFCAIGYLLADFSRGSDLGERDDAACFSCFRAGPDELRIGAVYFGDGAKALANRVNDEAIIRILDLFEFDGVVVVTGKPSPKELQKHPFAAKFFTQMDSSDIVFFWVKNQEVYLTPNNRLPLPDEQEGAAAEPENGSGKSD